MAWRSSENGDLSIGNEAAALAALPVSRRKTGHDCYSGPRPAGQQWHYDQSLAASDMVSPIRVRIAAGLDLDFTRATFASLSSSRAPQSTLDVLESPDGLTLWDGQTCLAQGEGDTPDEIFASLRLPHYLRKAWFEPFDLVGTVHGACMAIDGKSVGLLGLSGSGKSTFAAHLATKGARYVSDDIFPLSAKGKVFRYPVPPNLKENSWPLFADRFPELRDGPVFPKFDLNFRMLTSAPFVAQGAMAAPKLYVLLRFREGASLRHADLTLDEVFLRLVGREFWVADGKLRDFVDHFRQARCVALEYSDLSEAETFVRNALIARS